MIFMVLIIIMEAIVNYGRSATAAAGQATLLNNCSAALTEKCADITINATLSGACSDTMTAYKDKVATCKSDDSCTCWTEAYAMK